MSEAPPPPPPPPKAGRPVSQFAPPAPPPPPPRRASTGAPPPPSTNPSPVSSAPPVPAPPAPAVLSASPPVPAPPVSVLPPPPARPATPPPADQLHEKYSSQEAPPPPSRPPPPIPPTSSDNNNIIVTSTTPSSPAEEIVLEGLLSKRNREGTFDKCYLVLTRTCVRYGKAAGTSKVASLGDKLTAVVSKAANVATSGSMGAAGNLSTTNTTAASANAASSITNNNNCEVTLSESATEVAMETVLVTPLQSGDYDDAQKIGRAFRFRSKHKSFLLRAKTEEEADLWMRTFQQLSSEARRNAGIRSEPTDADLAPLWASNATANNCTLCKTNFTFFVRKHHCRNCGALVCESCSREKLRIPRLDEKQLFRVCTPCGIELKEQRSYGAAESTS